MGNTDKHKSKKCRRKIRIRLADPNIPDSYDCEVFDSSLENEEDIPKLEHSPEKVEDSSKPKNYFEILMPKHYRKNVVVNSSDGNVFDKNDEELLKRKRLDNSKDGNSSSMPDEKNEKNKCETDSSEDECLREIQRRSKLKTEHIKIENQCVKSETEQATNLDNDVITVFDSPKINLPKDKKLGILNYFSKSENKVEKLEENKSILNSIVVLCPKSVEKQNLIKTKNENKTLVNAINKENVKLAPLFNKKGNKITDSVIQRARLDFLYNGFPSIVKKPVSKISENVLDFPRIPHVQQRNDSACWSPRDVRLPLPEIPVSDEHIFSSTKVFSFKISDLTVVYNSDDGSKIRKDFISNVHCNYLPVVDGLKEKCVKFRTKVEKVEKTSRNQRENENTGFEELNTLWTEKYKPNSLEILENRNVVKKLKKWLQSWKSFDEELKILSKSNYNSKTKTEGDDENSDDDFMDENYGLKSPGNVCVISGPTGCGKTALVYALANELEFKVLELNASSKRTGKKVLSDLQEATQSHKVQRANVLQSSFQKIDKKKGFKKKRKNKKPENLANILEQSKDCKISLILIEDADIVFDDHDEGFFAAIASLVQTSKRPLIFLTNDRNCYNLYGFKPGQSLVLEMEVPSLDKSCTVLHIVSSLEGLTFEKELLQSLLLYNNLDLRKSLLQLQFWVDSGGKPVLVQRQFDLGHLWWGLPKFLFKRDLKHSVKPKTRKRKRINDLCDSSDGEAECATKKLKTGSDNSEPILIVNNDLVCKKLESSMESYFKVFDLVSSLDGFHFPGSSEPIPGVECRAKDGLSLSENMEESSWFGGRLTEEILNEMVTLSERIFTGGLNDKKNEERKLNFVPPCWEEIRWRNSQEKAGEELSLVVSLQRGRDKRSLHLDYLPALRSICRTERNRSEVNPKRKNRFYHYLNTLGLELTDENLEINCQVFDLLNTH